MPLSPSPTLIGARVEDLDTPSLLLDLDKVERNLATMAKLYAGSSVRLRPHAKTHKVPILALKQQRLDAQRLGVPWVSSETSLHRSRGLLQASGHAFSQDPLSHPGCELISGGQVLHLMQMQFVAPESGQLRIIQGPDQAGDLPSYVA